MDLSYSNHWAAETRHERAKSSVRHEWHNMQSI